MCWHSLGYDVGNPYTEGWIFLLVRNGQVLLNLALEHNPLVRNVPMHYHM